MNIAVAFLAGILTFFTPCVFPLIPSYISYITGSSLEELAKGRKEGLFVRSICGSLSFILGFSLIFVLFGVCASFAGSLVYDLQNYIRIIGGVVIIIFGLVMTGLIDFKFLEIEKRFNLNNKPVGYFGAVLLGMTFAAGWAPCVGPILSSILIIASTSGSRFYGGILLLSYSLGLGLPILISAVAFNYFLSAYKSVVKYLRVISIISGAILIIIGLLLVMDNLTLITSFFYNMFSVRIQ